MYNYNAKSKSKQWFFGKKLNNNKNNAYLWKNIDANHGIYYNNTCKNILLL